MDMSEEKIKDAVLALFSREKIPPGGGLFVFDLYERWSKTCLRESDLKWGIETLIRSGELAYSEGETKAFVRLSEAGYRRCLALGPRSWKPMRRVAQWLHVNVRSLKPISNSVQFRAYLDS